MGLPEHATKTQLSAIGCARRKRLAQIAQPYGLETAVSQHVEVLGVGWGDRCKAKERDRTKQAENKDLRVVPGVQVDVGSLWLAASQHMDG